MKNKIMLRPLHFANVSGGKDSLYMLYHILKNKEKYPLDMVVYFDLEIDYPFIKKVVDKIEELCKELKIKFWRIKPRKSWNELYEKKGYPSIKVRWCNSNYKLDCVKQIKEYCKNLNCRPINYIGLCANEKKRFKYNIGEWLDKDVCYPLAEDNIYEDKILEWARTQEIYNNWYNYFDRCGCMGCPCASLKEWTYLYKYYPKTFKELWEKLKKSEEKIKQKNPNYKYFYKTTEETYKKITTTNLKIKLF